MKTNNIKFNKDKKNLNRPNTSNNYRKEGEMNRKKRLTKEAILCLIKRLDNGIEGRKKLMKLMFLVDYFNINSEKITKSPLLGNDFIIYHYGVFSFEVMNDFIELVKERKVEDTFPIKLKRKQEELKLPQSIKEKTEKIGDKFGDENGYQLEIKTLEMLNIKPEEKSRYFGKSVKELIK